MNTARKRSRSKSPSRKKKDCPYGVKKDGTCKKKPGRKRSRSKSPSRKKKNPRKVYMTSSRCKEKLQSVIRLTMRDYKKGRFSSRKQAIAVAYSIVGKEYPNCKKIFDRARSR